MQVDFLHWSYFLYFSILLLKISNICKSRKNAVINPVCKSPSSVITHPRSIHSLYISSPPRLFQTKSGYSIISSVIYFRTNLCKIQSPFSNDLIITVSLVECISPRLVYRIFVLSLLYWGRKREGLLWIRLRQKPEKPEFDYCLYWGDLFSWFGLFWARFCLDRIRWVILLCKYGCINMQ